MAFMKRCKWANSSDLDAEYHDKEWGVVSTDDRHLFEMLILGRPGRIELEYDPEKEGQLSPGLL